MNRGQLGICGLVSSNTPRAYRGIRLHSLCEPVGILGIDLFLPLACDPPTVRHLGGHPLTRPDTITRGF
jgi:hypothetical protein